MKRARSAVLALLALGVCQFGLAEPDTKPKTIILNEDALDWEVSVYCGNRNIQVFVPGDKSRTSLSGMLVVDSKGNAYVAAGTFIAVVTTQGDVDVLTGHPDLAGNTDGPPGKATFGDALDITIVNDNLVYVVDAANCTLRRLTRTGEVWRTDTVAGVPGVEGHRDGPGRQALFSSVFDSVVAGENGAVYLLSGNWLRKYQNGTVTTLNPDGGEGYVNGPVRKACFRHSQGRSRALAYDGKGHLFVADKVNAAIRKLDIERGIISTVAGRLPDQPRAMPRDGRGADARFHPGGGPTTMVYDRVNQRFVIHDDDDQTIRVLTEGKDGWMVHSLGMRGEDAGDVRPRKVAGVPAGIDGQGNLYLARANHIQVLRKRPAAEK